MVSALLLSLAINARFPIPGTAKIARRTIVSVCVSDVIPTYLSARIMTTTMLTLLRHQKMRMPQRKLKLHDVYACVENMLKVPLRSSAFNVRCRTHNTAKIADPFDVYVLVPVATPTLLGL